MHHRMEPDFRPDRMCLFSDPPGPSCRPPAGVTNAPLRLPDDGRIPGRKAGTHHCVRARDILGCRRGTESRCRMALDELTAVDQDLGLQKLSTAELAVKGQGHQADTASLRMVCIAGSLQHIIKIAHGKIDQTAHRKQHGCGIANTALPYSPFSDVLLPGSGEMGTVVVRNIRYFRPYTLSIVQHRESQSFDSSPVDQRLGKVQCSAPIESHSEKQYMAIEVVKLLERPAQAFRKCQGMLADNCGRGSAAGTDGFHRVIAPQGVRPVAEAFAYCAQSCGSRPGVVDREMLSYVCQPGLRQSGTRPCRRVRAMGRRGRHDQRTALSEYGQERAHHGWRTTDNPSDRTQRRADQQGHPVGDADRRQIHLQAGFRPGFPCE